MSTEMATCLICRKPYKVCLSCKEKLKLKPWKTITDTEECWKIYFTLKQYNTGKITREQARENLNSIPFSKENIDPFHWPTIDEIMTEDAVAPDVEDKQADVAADTDEHSLYSDTGTVDNAGEVIGTESDVKPVETLEKPKYENNTYGRKNKKRNRTNCE